jgi:hypothetical protein
MPAPLSTRITASRLANQLITRQPFESPAEVVRHFGALQAQDYLGSLWALGLRTAKSSEARIEGALAEGSVLRTHIFRGTWQYVTPADVRWMLSLVGERVIASAASRHRQLGLDAKTLRRSADLIGEALTGQKHLTRRELSLVLSRRRIDTSDARLLHMLGHAELGGIICSGPRRGKQATFALLAERVPEAPSLTREQGLEELARRYFASRGPATERDFGWWTGLPLRDVRHAIELTKTRLERAMIDGREHWSAGETQGRRPAAGIHLLPAFDECLVAYRDRSAFVYAQHVRKINAGGGMLKPAVLCNGRVVGTWQRSLGKHHVILDVRPFRRLSARERVMLKAAAERYAAFLGLSAQALIR